MTLKTYEGACHCGAIGWHLHTSIAPADWVLRACQCSFCRAHDTRCVSDSNGRVDFRHSQRERVNLYRFGLRTADFVVCRHCGVYLGAVLNHAKGRFTTVNVNVLCDPIGALPEPQLMQYDTEDESARIDRRTRVWTPVGTWFS